MKPVVLIGVNFLRMQRVAMLIMLAYLAAMAALAGVQGEPGDLRFFLQQQAFYVVFLITVLAVPAVQGDRKSRRILAVLSKGIHRWQYLAGLFVGCGLAAAIVCLAMGAASACLAHAIAQPLDGAGELVFLVFLGSLAGAAVALFCSLTLHPLLALGAAAVILAGPLPFTMKGTFNYGALFPVAAVLQRAVAFRVGSAQEGTWTEATILILYTGLFLAAAAAVFARQDVTTSPE